jgi:predicted KAP-like P-loop ATPase
MPTQDIGGSKLRIVLENDAHNDEFLRLPLAGALAEMLLEHDRSRLPLNVGIFGAWGTGKTQFMKMTKGEVVRQSEPKPKTVWFKPWKYESRQDIGLGLMLAIVRAVENDKSTMKKIKSAAGKTGRFVWKVFGKSALAVADEVTPIDAGSILKESFNEVRLGSPIIQTEIDEALDELQKLISSWVGDDGRCYVFIDDLDRCLPDQMIALIEALHLYMVDTPCYFAVGVDREAISAAINDRYPRSESELGRVYLDKIFPVSVSLSPPTNTQLRAKYYELLEEQDLIEDEVNFVLEQLEQNPRSIERFINNYSLSRRLIRSNRG